MSILKLIAALGIFAATPSFAFSIPLLGKTFSNGPVSPRFQKRVECIVTMNEVMITKTMMDVRTTTKKPIQFTSSVPNIDQIVSLKQAAAKEETATHEPSPVGGPATTYTSIDMLPNDGTQSTVLLQMFGTFVRMENASNAAKTLVQFLDTNCKEAGPAL